MRKRFLVIIATVIMALALIIPMGAPVLAAGSPAGANNNNLSISLSVIPTVMPNHDTAAYYISLTNYINPNPALITADVQNVMVEFYPPGADGQPIATASFVDGPYAIAAGGPPVNLDVQYVPIDLDPGFTLAIARVHYSAVVLTDPQNSSVSGDKNINLDIIENSTVAHIGASVSEVPPGGGDVLLTITEFNNGNMALEDPYVDLTADAAIGTLPLKLEKSSLTFIDGDANDDGWLDVGETWQWQVTVFVDRDVTFTAIGHGLDPSGHDVTWPEFDTERDFVSLSIPSVPGVSGWGIGLMIGGFGAVVAFFVLRRARRSPQAS
jgi:hypothetical protein